MTTARIAVAIATYRRPSGLEALLASLAAMSTRHEFDLVVVDNDPDRSASPVCDRMRADLPFALRTVHEPVPGIAAARNAALDAAADHDLVCFVDDDEVVGEQWLDTLMRVREERSADAVTGPVDFVFEVDPPRWAVLGGFFVRPALLDGAECELAATNNVLYDVDALRSRALRFDDALGLTGGSDMLLSKQFSALGGRIVWSEHAVVRETVPAARCRSRWILRRAVRSGNTTALVERALVRRRPRLVRATTDVRLLVGGIARVLVGAATVASAPVVARSPRGARGLRTLLRGIGVVLACVERPVVEYARPPAR